MKTVMYTFQKELWMKLSLSFKYITAAETGIDRQPYFSQKKETGSTVSNILIPLRTAAKL